MSLFEHLHIRDSFLSGSFGAVAILRLMKKQKNLIFLMLPVLVAACGGDSSSDNSNEQNGSDSQPNTVVAINALDSTTSVRKGTTGIVGLQNEVKTSDGSPAYLSAVTPIGEQVDAQCRNVNIDANNLTFTVRANEIGACTYQYQVSDIHNNVSTTAISRVAVQSSTGPTAITYTLPPIGQTVTESQTINIDLEAELGSSFPNGGVVESSVTVLGSGSASADPATNTISYTAANESNVTRVLYTIIAGAEGEDVYLGTIDIAVSTTLNTAPTAQNFTYEDPQCLANNIANGTNYRCDQITSADNIVIDLADKIGDPDEGDEAQIIEVYAFDADVSLTSPEDPTSAEITFSTKLPKAYYISYVVSDHRGGYAIGQIEINVVGAFPYIIVDATSDVFAPPMTMSQAELLGLNILGVNKESEPTGPTGISIPTFDWETANAICVSKGGTLPTRDQLSGLINQEGFNLYVDNGWPSSLPFWTKDLTTDQMSAYAYDPIASISAGSKVFSTIKTTLGAYVSCIDKSPSRISISNIGVIPYNNTVYLNVNYSTASGVILPYEKPLLWSTDTPSIVDVEPDSGAITGLIVDEYADITATTYDASLSNTITVQVVDNLFVLANVDPSFESYVPVEPNVCNPLDFAPESRGSGSFGNTNWLYLAGTGGEMFTLFADCPENSSDGSDVFPRINMKSGTSIGEIKTLNKLLIPVGLDLQLEIDLKLENVASSHVRFSFESCTKTGTSNLWNIWSGDHDQMFFENSYQGFDPRDYNETIIDGEVVDGATMTSPPTGWHHYSLSLDMSGLNVAGQECRFTISLTSPSSGTAYLSMDNLWLYPISKP